MQRHEEILIVILCNFLFSKASLAKNFRSTLNTQYLISAARCLYQPNKNKRLVLCVTLEVNDSVAAIFSPESCLQVFFPGCVHHNNLSKTLLHHSLQSAYIFECKVLPMGVSDKHINSCVHLE